jgi:hypothetical protein
MEFYERGGGKELVRKRPPETYTISIEAFANLVKKHIDRCGQ